MGRRGPIPGVAAARAVLPMAARRLEMPETVPNGADSSEIDPRPVPRTPAGLGKAGRATWRAAHEGMPVRITVDSLTVERLARLVDEREMVAAELALGVLLEEPIVSPSGQVVGTRRVANPAAAMLRQIDRALDALVDRLALVPAARARLGLVMSTAERNVVETDALLAAKWRDR